MSVFTLSPNCRKKRKLISAIPGRNTSWMTYIFPPYLAISASTVTVMNTDTNQGTSYFSLFCFLEVMNFNVYVSKRRKQCQVTQHRIRRDEHYPNLLQSLLYQRLRLTDMEQCSLVFRLWPGFGSSHTLKGSMMGRNDSRLSTAGSLRWQSFFIISLYKAKHNRTLN